MGKSWKENRDKYKKFGKNKPNKFNKGNKPRHDDSGGDKKHSPFDDSQGYHESFGG